MNAKECEAILSANALLEPKPLEFWVAHGFLKCLTEGEEVKKLVDALQRISQGPSDLADPRVLIASAVLLSFRESIGDGKK